MKKIYIQPEMLAVVLQHNQVIATSPITDQNGNSQTTIGGSSDGYQGSDGGNAKGSTNVWDQEW